MKIIGLAGLLSIAMVVLAGCGEPPMRASAPKPVDRLWQIAARGELRVCSTGDYRPFTYYQPGTSTWSGIDVDMADDLAHRLGVRRVMVQTSWKNLVHDFTAACDIAVGGVSITPDRARAAFFSEPYLDDGKAPIVRCGNEAWFQTLAQINRPEVRVIVNLGGTNEQFVRANLAGATVVVHQDNNTIHQEIAAGHADLMITDSTEAVCRPARMRRCARSTRGSLSPTARRHTCCRSVTRLSRITSTGGSTSPSTTAPISESPSPGWGDRQRTGQPLRFSRAAAMTAYAASSATTQKARVARATGCS